MPKKYSHSRLSIFEHCPLKYKYRYIDQIVPELERTIETLLGNVIHETLEWLYEQTKNNKVPTIDELIVHYSKNWEENYTPNLIIVQEGLTARDFFNKGIRFLLDYYLKYHPFKENTIALEKKVEINLGENKEYILQGFIDRLVHNKELDEYEVHDYKTSGSLPTKEKIDTDRQLALYSIAIKELYGKDKNVCLVWHYLNFNKKICSRRTDEQLEKLKQDILELIKKIEQTKEFPSNKSPACKWCEYISICPEFSSKTPKTTEKPKLPREEIDRYPTLKKYLRE